MELCSPFIQNHSIVLPHGTLNSSLQLYLSKLNYLKFLELDNITLQQDYMQILKEYLKSHPTCKTLKLVHCGIKDSSLIMPLLECETVEELDLSHNWLSGPESLEALSQYLPSTSVLKKLSLYGNRMVGEAFSTLLEGITGSSIEVLDVGCNLIYRHTVYNWILLRKNYTLQSLVLRENPLGWDCRSLSVADLDGFFMCISPALTTLDISYCDITSEHVEQLCKVIDVNKLGLQHIYLSSNSLKGEAIQYLAKLLSHNKEIKRYVIIRVIVLQNCSSLDLSFNDIREEVGKAAEMFRNNQTLTYLDLGRTYLNDKAAERILNSLLKNKHGLKYLNLEMNTISESKASEMATLLPDIHLLASNLVDGTVTDTWRRR